MSLAYMSMAATSYMEGPAPQFKVLDDKYVCVYCKGHLKQPQQTACGCRICAPCVDEILRNNDSARCPGGDDFCEDLTKESVRVTF